MIHTRMIKARFYNCTRIVRVYHKHDSRTTVNGRSRIVRVQIQARFSSTQFFLVRMKPNTGNTHKHIDTRKNSSVSRKSCFGSVNSRTLIKYPEIRHVLESGKAQLPCPGHIVVKFFPSLSSLVLWSVLLNFEHWA